MAETISNVVNTVFGNFRVSVQRVTNGANSSTADVPTELSYVDFAVVQPLHGSAAPTLKTNVTNAATATNGTVAIKSGTSAASMLLISFGQ